MRLEVRAYERNRYVVTGERFENGGVRCKGIMVVASGEEEAKAKALPAIEAFFGIDA